MIKTKTIKTETEETTSVVCDCCKKEISLQWGGDYIPIKYSGGFGSRYPGDLTTINFELCEDCFEKIIRENKIDVRINEWSLYK